MVRPYCAAKRRFHRENRVELGDFPICRLNRFRPNAHQANFANIAAEESDSMRNNQIDMPPLASIAHGRQRERLRGRPARPRLDTLPESDRQRECTFTGIDSELVRSKPLVAAIAREICEAHGGNEVLNWLEAEILLENALSDFPHHLRDREKSR
jgi:hypothetical protein